MYRIREALIRFMSGRNGMDNLNMVIFWIYLVLLIASMITQSLILNYISLFLVIVFLFRSLSRNIYKRQLENEKYLEKTKGIRSHFKRQKNKWRDRKTHIYKKCPGCKTYLRLPKQKGTHIAVCPKCREEFEVKVR